MTNAISSFSLLDQDEAKEEKEEESQSAKEYRRTYMEKYSVQFDIPSVDIQSSVFYPANPNYFMQTQKYNLPSESDYSVSSHCLDGKVLDENYTEVFDHQHEGVLLRLILQDRDLHSMHSVK